MIISKTKHRIGAEKNTDIGWLPELYSGINPLIPDQHVNAYEFRVKDLKNLSTRDLAKDAREQFIHSLKNIFDLGFYCADSRPELKSRVRNYKSVFPYKGSIYQSGFAQLEISKKDKLSVLVGEATVNDSNIQECCRLAMRGSWSFFLIGRNSQFHFDETFASSAFGYSKISFVNLPFLLKGIGVTYLGVICFREDQDRSISLTVFCGEGIEQQINELSINAPGS